MEVKEIEQRIADAVNEIPLESVLQESKNKLKTKLERFEENLKNKHYGRSRRLRALELRRARNIKEKCIDIGINCMRTSVLIILGLFVYQLIKFIFS